jgi:hypothetical protein
MDIGKAFTFLFEDEEKIKKLLIGILVSIIPIVQIMAIGYVVELVRNLLDDVEYPLPEWDRFGDYFMDGLKITVGLLVYSIPIILPTCVYGVAAIAVSGGAVNSSEADTVMGVLTFCLACFVILFAFIPLILYPAILARYAETGEFGSVFRIRDLWSFIQRDMGGYGIVLVVSVLAAFFLAPLGLLLCFIGAFFTQWWVLLAMGHLTGQLARNNAEMMA